MLNESSIKSLKRLLNVMQKYQGVQLENYSIPHLVLLLEDFMDEHRIQSVEELIDKVSLSGYWYEKLLSFILVDDTELFRDPTFWKLLGDTLAQTYSGEISVWFPDLVSGEELYSFIITCIEIGIYDRVSIEASSVCRNKLETVRNGFINAKNTNLNVDNYKRFNGLGDIEKYFVFGVNKIYLKSELLKKVKLRSANFFEYNQDRKHDLVIFRNKMLYFNTTWKNEALGKLHKALKPSGFLVIGINEDFSESMFKFRFSTYNLAERIYRKR